jgi:hypothetical protein
MARVIRRQKGKWSGERGSILALSALSMVSVLLAVGLNIDVGHFYIVSAELQNAADAAALSGASALNSGPTGIHLAVDRAVAAMNKYEFNKIGVTINRSDVRFAINLSHFDEGWHFSENIASISWIAPYIRFVRVRIPPRSINVFFATSVLGNTVDMTKEAVAGASISLNYFCNIAPLSVVQDDETGEPLNVEPGCPNQTVFTPGCRYIVRLQGGDHVVAGNYLILDLDGGGGGADEVREDLARGTNSCYAMNSVIDTKTGVNAGPVADGINTRFDIYHPSLTPAFAPPDKNVKGRVQSEAITYQQYVSEAARNGDSCCFQAPPNNPTYAVGDRRVMIIPILNKSEFTEDKKDGGRIRNLRIHNFGAFFIRSSVNGNNGDIYMEYIGQRAVFGDGGYDPSIAPGPNPSLTVPVLYR